MDVIQALAANISRIWNTLSGVSVVWALLAVVFALAVYFLPTIFAVLLGHSSPRAIVIGVLNLFLGWTGILWFVLLGWAIIGRPKPADDEAAPEDMVPLYHTPGTN